MTQLTDIAALVGALGVGSLGTALFTQGRERRASRAAVIAAMHEVERHRWASSDRSFREAARELATAAMIARMPRWAVDEYLALARAASWMSAADADERGAYDEYAGGISGELNGCVHAAFGLAVDVAWHPVASRLRARQRRAGLSVSVSKLSPQVRRVVEDARRSS